MIRSEGESPRSFGCMYSSSVTAISRTSTSPTTTKKAATYDRMNNQAT